MAIGWLFLGFDSILLFLSEIDTFVSYPKLSGTITFLELCITLLGLGMILVAGYQRTTDPVKRKTGLTAAFFLVITLSYLGYLIFFD